MLRYNNDVYENCCMNEKCYLNWFEMFDCLLLLGFKLCKVIWEISCWLVLLFHKECIVCKEKEYRIWIAIMKSMYIEQDKSIRQK
jgi:hypothetical protein